jgi:hypothetical protein
VACAIYLTNKSYISLFYWSWVQNITLYGLVICLIHLHSRQSGSKNSNLWSRLIDFWVVTWWKTSSPRNRIDGQQLELSYSLMNSFSNYKSLKYNSNLDRMLHTLQFALGVTLLVSSAMSYRTTETFISDFLLFQKQAAPPAAVGAFLCWRHGMPHWLSTSFIQTPNWPKFHITVHADCLSAHKTWLNLSWAN